VDGTPFLYLEFSRELGGGNRVLKDAEEAIQVQEIMLQLTSPTGFDQQSSSLSTCVAKGVAEDAEMPPKMEDIMAVAPAIFIALPVMCCILCQFFLYERKSAWTLG
jgi:hypothetical protein